MSTPQEPGASASHHDNRHGRKISRRRREAAKQKKRTPFQPFFHTLEKRMMLATFVVMNANDSGPDSLRQAITDSNGATAGPNEIDFNIGTGAQTISLISALPPIAVPVTIDGTTQPGYAGTPLIDLDGTSAGPANGLDFEAGSDGSVVSGLAIGNFSEDGILIVSAGNTIGGAAAGAGNVISGNASDGVQITGSLALDNVIAGNYIGTDFTGMVAMANGTGVQLDTGASGNTIGGLTATPGTGAGNVISGNTTAGVRISGTDISGNVVAGNLIGTNVDGTGTLGNGSAGISVNSSGNGTSSGQNVIGGTTAGAGNVVSGNGTGGIYILRGNLDIVAGNLIGTDVSGTVAVPNVGPGIVTSDGSGITIGGTAAGAGNVVSGNDDDGIDITSDTGDLVAGNKIGTDTSGTFALGNFESGVVISGGVSNTIGGAAAGAGNVISGNTSNDGIWISGVSIDNVIAGNFIGTDVTGNVAIPNGTDGIEIDNGASGNTIGGLTATPGTGAGNVISGNEGPGISDSGDSNLIAGNLIGTNASGTAALTNRFDGIDVYGGGDTIGGAAAGAGNVISGNTLGDGIYDDGANAVVAGNFIGTDLTGTVAIANATGIEIDTGASGNTIGGLTATPGTGAGNVISGNTGLGISDGGESDVIAGNLVGTTAGGTAALPNLIVGIATDISAIGDTIGGTAAGAGNVVSGNTENGVEIGGTDNLLAGNFIGTDITGTVAIANAAGGVELDQFGTGNTVGGLTATAGTGAGNVISGNNAYGISDLNGSNLIAGNLIGTSAGGTAALANIGDGVDAYGVTIGGTAAGAGNVISGNTQYGINDYGVNLIAGNLIGTDLSGTVAVSNGFGGITLGGSGSTVGGTTVGAGNVISGNRFVGIEVSASGNLVIGNKVGTSSDGTAALANTGDGIDLDASGNTIGGLTATPGTGAGNVISGNHGIGINDSSGSNLIVGNLIGTNASGTAGVANTGDGIDAYGDTIGGTVAGARNVISGNTQFGISDYGVNLIAGNLIGTDLSGTVAVPNGFGGISMGSGSTIGGTTVGAGNVISGNGQEGITGGIVGTGNLIAGNRIGTSSDGSAVLANQDDGIDIYAGGNTIGGTTAAAGNVISGNVHVGVSIYLGTGNLIVGNLFGTNAADTAAMANNEGIDVYSGGDTIGGTTAGSGNVLSGNGAIGLLIGYSGATDNVVLGNRIGTDLTGTVAIGNNGDGVYIEGGASGNSIGGTAAGAGNVISGNTVGDGVEISGAGTSGNVVEGDDIGTDLTGTVGIANANGIEIDTGASGNTIGGLTATPGTGAGNIISGNDGGGMIDFGGSNLIAGNLIGLSAGGTAALASLYDGIDVYGAGDTIGGTAAGAGNVISGNTGNGVDLAGAGATGNVVAGNLIGTDITGTTAFDGSGNPLGNDSGVEVDSGARDNTIGGTTSGSGNVISGNGDGVYIYGSGTSGNLVQGDDIGTDVTGSVAIANTYDGVQITVGASDNTIGGVSAGARNVISGNLTYGVEISGAGSSGNVVEGDSIGTDSTGTRAIANGTGVELYAFASDNTIGATTAGAGNTIADNTGDGVQVLDAGTIDDAIRGNSIFGNGILGIELVTFLEIELGTSGVPSTNILGGSTSGPNNDENYPVLTIVSYAPGIGTTIAGNINTTPNTTVFVDFYTDAAPGLDGYGQGQTYVGSVTVTTTDDGNASFTFLSTSLPRNAIVSATATDDMGNTSEFSLDQAEESPPSAGLVARPSLAGPAATTFNEGQTITFDGSGSVSPDGDTLTYTWDFNDGTLPVTTASPTETHAYHYDGTYVVTLTVNDGHGGIESNIDILTINKLPPTITFNPLPTSLAVGTTLHLTGTIDDPTPDLETVVLNWGDGSNPTTLKLPAGSSTFSASHDYASQLPGGATTATISATVTDASNQGESPEPSPIGPLSPTPTFDVGGLSGSTSAMLTVVQQAPTIAGLTLSQSTVNVGGSTTLSGTIVDPDAVVSHTVTIQWGDTLAPTTLVLPPGDLAFSSTHEYESTPGDSLSGSWPIDVTVVNSELAAGSAAPPAVTAVDVSPVVQIESLPLSTTGSLVSLISNATEPGTLNQLTYQWTVTTGGVFYASGTGQTLSFVSINGGVFTATVVVTDQDGATGQASAQVVVGPSSPNNTVIFNPAGAGLVTLTADGSTSSPFAPGNGIIYYARGATNVVEAAPTLTTPIELVGSTGGTNTLIGGAGDDTLVSVLGNDYLEGTTGDTDFVLILGHDPTLVASTGINTIDLSQTPQNITLNLGSQTVQSVDSAGDIVLLQGTFQKVIAGPGNDTLTAANGVNSSLIGGSGNDIIYGTSSGNDSIVGGTGNDTVVGGGGNDIIYGTSSGNDSIVGGTGNDTVVGGGGNDIIYGTSSGNDSIVGGSGNDTVVGGGGNDIIYGTSSGNDSIVGGTGNDTVVGGGGNDIIYGTSSGNDSIVGGTGNDTVVGGGGNDIIYGTSSGNDSIVGGSGNDTVVGGGGNDIIYGTSSGNDSIVGGSGNDTVVGGGGNDIIYGTSSGNDSIVGGTGNDTVVGGGGNDIIYGTSSGNDSIVGGTGNDTVVGGGGNDIIYGTSSGDDSIVGGSGNDTVVGGGGNDIIYGTSSGNDSIVGGSGNDTVVGGGGNDIIYGTSSGNDSIVGGSGNDTVVGGGGNDIIYGTSSGNDSIVGGSGNDTVVGGGGNDIIYGTSSGNDSIVGGTGNDTVVGGGGNDIIYGTSSGNDSIVGGSGNDTVVGGGGNDIIYGTSSGNDSIVGGSGNDTVVGGGGNDIIYGTSSGNDSIVGGTGNDTITGGGGNDIIFGGPGDDSIAGGTGFNTISGGGGSDIISGGANDWLIETDPLGNTVTPTTVTLTNSTLAMPGYGTDTIAGITNIVVGLGDGKIVLDASQDTMPLVLVAGTGDDTILAGPGDDTMYAGSGTDSLVGGGGNDVFVFGPLTQGNVTVNDRSTTNNTLDFSLFTAGINLDLQAVGPQAVSPGLLNLTLANPLSIDKVVGTAYPDTIQGDGRNDTLIGNGGDDYLNAQGGAGLIEGFQTQVVYLDFLPGVVDYSSQSTRDAIQAGIGAIYSAFNFTFTQTQPTSGPYETLYFNVPAGSLLAGEATDLDWRNLDLGGSASIDISQFLGGPDYPADTLTNIINMSATIGAHELGHLSGLLHGDSFGPIGAGIYANLADNAYLDGFNPPYTGPANAVGTQYDVIASPASVGTSLFDAANVTFFGERDDITLAFADSGTATSETPGDPNTSVATAQPLTLAPLAVPNTLLIGQGTGDTFNVTAADVVGSIELGSNGQSNADYYAITATAGELLNFQVRSQSLTRDNGNAIDSELTIYEADGTTVVPYNGSPAGAFSDDGFQDADAVLYDLTMPYTGTYYVKVNTYVVTDSFNIVHNSSVGNYELFMYSFATTPSLGTPAASGDTLVGSSGQDTLVGSSASDLIEAVPGDSVVSGSGADTVDTLPYDIAIADPPLQVESQVALTGSFVASNPGMSYTYDWHVSASNGQVIADARGTAAVDDGAGTTSFQFTPTAAGAYTITLTITDGYGGVNQGTLEETAGTITPFTSQIGSGASEITGTSGTPISLSATATGTYAAASYSWAVSAPATATPPAPGSGASYAFTPTSAGNYTVTLTATDTAGDVAVSTLTVIVPFVAPSAQIVGVPAHEYVPEGEAFSLAGVVNDPATGDDLTESWTVTPGDGSEAPYTASGLSVTYTPEDIGSYTVTLNLLDANGEVVASASQQILSIGVAPTASISGGPLGGTTTEGTTLAFSGAASSPSTVTSAKGFFFTWGVTLGAFAYVAPTTPTTNPTSFSFTPGQAGTYVVSLSVTDEHGFTSVAATQTVAVSAVAPSVTITGLPAASVTAGTTVALGSVVTNPSAALESAGFSESWTVQFGGATYGPYHGPVLNLTLGSVGSYTVDLSATDAEGISSTTTEIVTAADSAPVVTPSASPTAQSPEQATVTAFDLGSVVGAGLDDGTGFVTVNWGDGTLATKFPISSQGEIGLRAHAYDLPGTYQVSVTVTDVYGLSGSESFTTTVAPVAPSPEIQSAPASMNAGSSVTLSSSVTDQSQAETAAGYTYAWSVLRNGLPYTLPGNPSTSGPSLGFTPTLGGSYTISLSTTDSSGSVGAAPPQTIVVNDLNTTTSLASSGSPSVSGQNVTFTATVSITGSGSNAVPNPSGTVTFYDNGVTIGTGTLSGTGTDTATFTTSALSTATHPITAAYTSGDASFNASSVSASISQAVNKANTATSVVSSGSTVSGQSVSFTATVSIVSPGTSAVANPNGAVNFYDGTTLLGSGALSGTSADTATFTTSTLSTASHQITATYADDTNFNPSTSGAITETVSKASTATSVVSSGSTVFGQSVTFTATMSIVSPGTGAVAKPTGTVTFYDNGVAIGTGTLSGTASDTASFTTSALSTATHPITAAYTGGDGNFNAGAPSTAINQVVNKASTTTVVSSSANPSVSGQSVTFTATVSIVSPGTSAVANPTGTVNFYDGNTLLGSGTLSGTGTDTATFTTSSLSTASHQITAMYADNANFNSSTSAAITQAVNNASTSSGSIYVLDPTAGGALTLSGNASIDIPGNIIVDSSSSTAITASGNASVKGAGIQVKGGVQKSGNATFSPAPITGAPVVSNPLAGLTAPTYSGTPISETLSGNSTATINPGVYSQITVSGNASLTLNPGIYIIAGGGLSVSGNANITGTGVMIYNTKSSTGTYGSITLSGNGTIKLTGPTTGAYAGILIFQDVNNSKALTFSGNAMQGITGTIYAPSAQLVESGNAEVGSTINPLSIIVDTLTISGNAIANALSLSSPAGTVAYTPTQIRAAYGINDLALDGTGQTIAIVDAYDDPAIYPALDAFDTEFGLTSAGATLYDQYGPAAAFLTVLNQNGQATSLPGTDPTGPGAGNWEMEETLDVEWAHAIAPGAQIILVEANSQSLADLMAGVATAASQPGVSVVSMSWGFAEGQAVLAGDEATYDSVFTTPGVTFVASTGDYGAADPEYPAFSPNVLAVGGTSLTLNADDSYNSETGFGYDSSALGTLIGSGGGISLYEPEPAYQEGVQSTGSRTIPDVSLVADPATGAWVADPYNLSDSNPFEVVGGTSLAAPCWAGLVALANQGRAAAGARALDSASPTETQEALYRLPQSDFNVITSGSNGYSAASGYNLVTGLGTPVANLLVTDLIAYTGPGTFYSGPTVAALQNADLVNAEASAGAPTDVFSVFDSFTLAGNGAGHGWARGGGSTDRAGQAVGAAGPSVSRQDLNIAGMAPGTEPLERFGERPAPPSIFIPAAAGTGLASLDLALDDLSNAFDTTTSSIYPVARIRLSTRAVGDGKTTRATLTPPVPAIDRAAVLALLGNGWSPRSSWIADRPRESTVTGEWVSKHYSAKPSAGATVKIAETRPG